MWMKSVFPDQETDNSIFRRMFISLLLEILRLSSGIFLSQTQAIIGFKDCSVMAFSLINLASLARQAANLISRQVLLWISIFTFMWQIRKTTGSKNLI